MKGRGDDFPLTWAIDLSSLDSEFDESAGGSPSGSSSTVHSWQPIKASWAHATDVLLGQYNEAIEANMPRRKELHSVTHALTHLFKAVLFCLTVYLILRSYTRKVLKPSVLKMYKFIIRVRWAQC